MSTPEPVQDDPVVDDSVEALAHELGEAITNLPEYEAFEEAKDAVEADEAAQAKIDEFERERQEFMLARQSGDATQQDMRDLQQTQEELHDIPVMAEYLEAQDALDDRLETLNEAISSHIAVDFGEQAGGCCKD